MGELREGDLAADRQAARAARVIMVVEDSRLLHQMADLLLLRYRQQGWQVLHAYNGREAIARLREHPYCDLILLDLIMPEMDGYEFLEYRRTRGFYPQVPTIIISTRGSKEDIEKGLQAGAAAFLPKPINSKEFYELVDRILGKNASPDQGSQGLQDNH